VVDPGERSQHDDGFRRLGAEPEAPFRAREGRELERLVAHRPELRPRGVGEILDVGIDVLRARFAACVLPCVLLWLLPAWLQAYMPPEEWAASQLVPGSPEIGALLGMAINTGLAALVQAFAAMVVALIARGEFAGEPLGVGAALVIVLRRLLPLLFTAFLVVVITSAGMIACVLPYFFLLWRLSIAPLVCAIEGLGPLQSLARSFNLTSGTFLRWLGYTVVGGLLATPLSVSVSLATLPDVRHTALDGLVLSPELYSLGLWLAGTLFLGVATAVGAAFTTAFYYDCRVRREALDLRERLAAFAPARASA
jgi:hypothetical protein